MQAVFKKKNKIKNAGCVQIPPHVYLMTFHLIQDAIQNTVHGMPWLFTLLCTEMVSQALTVFFMILRVLGTTDWAFCRLPFNLDFFWCFSPAYRGVMGLEKDQRNKAPFLLWHLKGTQLITDGDGLDCLAGVSIARLLHTHLLLSPFQIVLFWSPRGCI